MTTHPQPLDLSPAPGAARVTARWAAQGRMEWRVLMTNGEQLLLTLVIPVAALALVVRTRLATVDEAMPGILGLAILSSAFTATAIATGFERRAGVLKYLGTTPLGRAGLLVGKAMATLGVILGQALALAVAGLLGGWSATVGDPLALVGALALGTAALGSWGFALAGLLRAEATLAVANALFLLLMVGGGLVLPVGRLPEPVQVLVEALPTHALGDALRSALGQATSGSVGLDLALLLAWAVAGTALAARTFRWE